jgi:hypothetical protein
MKLFECQSCGQPLYFENTRCESCGLQLGYLPSKEAVTALKEDNEGLRALADSNLYRYCGNRRHDVCNWLIPADSAESYCVACCHNRTIPDLSLLANATNWRKIEVAKHRLFYTLLKFRLPVSTKTEDPENGLAFDFLAHPLPNDAAVMTGHASGLITISLAEADDSERERQSREMGEPYRTLLGHFRHEIAHYYWGRLVNDQHALDEFRGLFGDERQDYTAALQNHYAQGPPANWSEQFVTAYASVHPWEDFAECWAHYFHMIDTLETAGAFGLHLRPKANKDLATTINFDPHTAAMDRIIDSWLPLTFAVNSINRSMGITDLYPFVLTPTIIVKLSFIHDRIHAAQGQPSTDLGALWAVIAGLKRAIGVPESN